MTIDTSFYSCRMCRFGDAATDPNEARCLWVTGTSDDAGDRMPSWAHEILREHAAEEIGPLDRAETCPAFEVDA